MADTVNASTKPLESNAVKRYEITKKGLTIALPNAKYVSMELTPTCFFSN